MRSLLLNASYEPLSVITWQKAIILLVKGKVEVIDSYDRKIRGVRITLDLPSVPGQGGLVLRNPNRPNPLGDIGQLELTGDLADQVQQLLELRINPALASHGGYATLVGVEGAKVFVTMGGGCQGCALSAATLREGITAAIIVSPIAVRV